MHPRHNFALRDNKKDKKSVCVWFCLYLTEDQNGLMSRHFLNILLADNQDGN